MARRQGGLAFPGGLVVAGWLLVTSTAAAGQWRAGCESGCKAGRLANLECYGYFPTCWGRWPDHCKPCPLPAISTPPAKPAGSPAPPPVETDKPRPVPGNDSKSAAPGNGATPKAIPPLELPKMNTPGLPMLVPDNKPPKPAPGRSSSGMHMP